MKNLFFILIWFFGATLGSTAHSVDNDDALASLQEEPLTGESRTVTLSSGGFSLTFDVNCDLNCESIDAGVAAVSLSTGVSISVDCEDCDPDSSTPANGNTIQTMAEFEAAVEDFAYEVLANRSW